MSRSFDETRHDTLLLMHLATDILLAARTTGAVESNAKQEVLASIFHATSVLRAGATPFLEPRTHA